MIAFPQDYLSPRRLGSGWSSIIYSSRERQSGGIGRAVVIKRLRRRIRDQNSALSRTHLVGAMQREAAALRNCRHKNIPRFIEWLEVCGDPCIVMERLPGKTMSQVIGAQGALSWQLAFRTVVGLLGILECVHRVGWIHCDLNPSNLLLEGHDTYLLDFGAAQRIGEPPQWDWPLGRHRYMPPEHLQGRNETPRYSRLCFASDLHQVACLLVYALTLRESFRLPLEEEEYATEYLTNLGRWMNRPAVEKVRVLSVERYRSDVPAGLDGIISRALEPDPCARFTSAGAMKAEILALE